MAREDYESEASPESPIMRRRRALRTNRPNQQALLIAAVPIVVLVAVIAIGVWAMRSRGASNSLTPTPTHLPTLKPATLVAVKSTDVAVTKVPPTWTPTTGPATQPQTTPAATSPAILPTDTPTLAAPTGTPIPETRLPPGAKARVYDTGGRGLRLRGGPGLDHPTLKVLEEGTVVDIIGGPQSADDYEWYQIRDDSGAEGWAAGDWLVRAE